MIVVTAPTGHIGARVVAGLLAHEEPLRLVARDAGRLPADVRDRVEVVTGSHHDRDVLDRALDGADMLFWLMPAERTAPSIYDAYVTASLPGAEAVVEHGVERVVTVSALGRGTGLYAGHVSASLAMDDLFRSTGAHVRALANASFMDNVLRQLPGLRDGVLSDMLPLDLRLPYVATKDIAATAVQLLTDPTWAGQDTVDLLGGEDLSLHEMAAVLSDVLGTPIRAERSDRGAQRAALLAYGFSPAVAQAMLDMYAAKERGLDHAVARTSDNTTPTTFRAFAEEVVRPAFLAG